MQFRQVFVPTTLIVGMALSGCASPYRADRGAVFGGLMGAGLGTVVGAATGEPLAGAAIGGIAGTATGAAVGGALDNIEARNQAAIAAQMGRRRVRAVSIADVVAMTQSGVQENVIATHVRNNGMARPLSTNDIIYLQRCGVSPTVIQTMQTAPPPGAAVAGPPTPGPAYVSPPPPIVVADPHPLHFPMHHPHHWDHHPHHGHGPGFSWGVSVSSDDF